MYIYEQQQATGPIQASGHATMSPGSAEQPRKASLYKGRKRFSSLRPICFVAAMTERCFGYRECQVSMNSVPSTTSDPYSGLRHPGCYPLQHASIRHPFASEPSDDPFKICHEHSLNKVLTANSSCGSFVGNIQLDDIDEFKEYYCRAHYMAFRIAQNLYYLL